jgi:hypothetical protein
MAITDWSATPASNTTINSIDIAENCPPAGINNAIREVIGQTRAWYNALLPYEALSADDTQAVNDANKVLGVDASGGAKTITLPTAASIGGRVYSVIKTDSGANTVTLDGDGSETIDGLTTQVLRQQFDALTVVSNGTNWQILQDRRAPLSFYATLAADVTAAGAIAFDQVTDLGGCYTPATGRFTALRAGTYALSFHGIATEGNTLSVTFDKNGGTTLGAVFASAVTAGYASGSGTIVVTLAAGDYVTVNNAGSGATVLGDATLKSAFTGWELR